MARPERFELPTLCFEGRGDLYPAELRARAVVMAVLYDDPNCEGDSKDVGLSLWDVTRTLFQGTPNTTCYREVS